MPKWAKGLWHSHNWRVEEDLLAEFDKMEYHFVDDDYETGSEMFQRILSMDGTASKRKDDHAETETEHQDKWRYDPLSK